MKSPGGIGGRVRVGRLCGVVVDVILQLKRHALHWCGHKAGKESGRMLKSKGV